MTERKKPGVSWESFVEQQIREAQEAGEFDHLPGFGKPIPDIDQPHDEMWWLKKKARDENLQLLPPALEIRLDVERTLQSVSHLKSEAEVRETIAALNDRIRKAHFAAIWGPPCTTLPVDVEDIVKQWRGSK